GPPLLRSNQIKGCPEHRFQEPGAMQKIFSKVAPIFAAIAITLVAAPAVHAQIQGSVTHITPVPDGAYFSVDGQVYTHAASAVWPAGSKHILYVGSTTQTLAAKTQLTFKGWEFGDQSLPFNPLTVTADSSISEYRALFDLQYALS